MLPLTAYCVALALAVAGSPLLPLSLIANNKSLFPRMFTYIYTYIHMHQRIHKHTYNMQLNPIFGREAQREH